MKFFMHPDLDDFRGSELVPRFSKVVVDKPKESRKGMWVAQILPSTQRLRNADEEQNLAKRISSA
jgi:hypothetical protein